MNLPKEITDKICYLYNEVGDICVLEYIHKLDLKDEKAKYMLNNMLELNEKMLDTDIFGYVEKDGYISIQVFHIRSNKMVVRNGFLFEVMEDASEMFVDFLGQFYFVYNNPLPKEILLPDVDVSFVDERIKNKIYHFDSSAKHSRTSWIYLKIS